MTLYFIRHGQSQANCNGCFAGQSDSKLTDKGRDDARKAKEYIKGLKFDKIYSSDLSRAIETQEIILPNANVERSSLIREIHVGHLAGRALSECLTEYGEKLMINRSEYNFLPYGGENSEMMKQRINKFLSEVVYTDLKKVAVFCHGGVINMMLELVLGVEVDKTSLLCDNCSVNVFEYTDGKWFLRHWNYTGTI